MLEGRERAGDLTEGSRNYKKLEERREGRSKEIRLDIGERRGKLES
jgi:hypothetical protein